MKILVLGGTRFFGIHMVKDLISKGHDVTIATRGKTKDEFGDAVSRLCEQDFTGAINGSSSGTISINDIMEYIEKKTGKSPIITEDGDAAPYNGEPEYSINTEKAASLGFRFSNLSDWIYDLIDYYIAESVNK